MIALRRRAVAFAAVALLALPGCGGTSHGLPSVPLKDDPTPNPAYPSGALWSLTIINDTQSSAHPIPISVSFDTNCIEDYAPWGWTLQPGGNQNTYPLYGFVFTGWCALEGHNGSFTVTDANTNQTLDTVNFFYYTYMSGFMSDCGQSASEEYLFYDSFTYDLTSAYPLQAQCSWN